MLDTVEMQ